MEPKRKNFEGVIAEDEMKLVQEFEIKTSTNSHMIVNSLHIANEFGRKDFHSTETMMLGLTNDDLLEFDEENHHVILRPKCSF